MEGRGGNCPSTLQGGGLCPPLFIYYYYSKLMINTYLEITYLCTIIILVHGLVNFKHKSGVKYKNGKPQLNECCTNLLESAC